MSIRIGVNAGSLDKRLLEKYGKATPEALVESAVWEASLFEEHDFHDFKISVKHNDPVVMVLGLRAARPSGATGRCTSASPRRARRSRARSSRRSRSARCSSQGIGDTIRVSLSAPPVEEVKVGLQILQSLNLRPRKLEIVSCPSCGRAQVDVYTLAEQVTAGSRGPRRCRCASPSWAAWSTGRARRARRTSASRPGNGKGQIFVRARSSRPCRSRRSSRPSIEEAMALAEEMGVDAESGEVTRSSSIAVRQSPVDSSAGVASVRVHVAERTVGTDRQACCVPTLRLLDRGDLDELRSPCAAPRTLVRRTCFVAARVCTPAALHRDAAGRALGGTHRTAATRSAVRCAGRGQPRAGRDDPGSAIDAFADRARRQGRHCSSLVGPARRRARPVEPARAVLGPGA